MFNDDLDKKWTSGNELKYLKQVLSNTAESKANSFTAKLENDFADLYDAKYAIAMNSATSAIHTALIAAGVGPGDEVITTPYTVLVDSGIPILVGATPVFADIEYDTHNIDPKSIEDRITDKTKAIIPVSYHGLPYDIDAVMDIARRHNLVVIEDNAQTQLALYKDRLIAKDAHMSLFSFERTKHLSCGEGGMLITDNEELAIEARKFAGMGFKNLTAGKSKMVAITPRDFQRPDYTRHDRLGLNYRFNEFCAAVVYAQFERVEELVTIRQNVASLYDEVFAGTDFEPQTVPEGSTSAYFTYAVKSPFDDAEDWIRFYNYHNDPDGVNGDDFYGMMQPAYREPIMTEMGYTAKYENICPVAEKVQRRSMLFKTNYRSLDEAKHQIDRLAKSLTAYKEGLIV